MTLAENAAVVEAVARDFSSGMGAPAAELIARKALRALDAHLRDPASGWELRQRRWSPGYCVRCGYQQPDCTCLGGFVSTATPRPDGGERG